MKVLICLSVVLALANAGHLAHNQVYINGAYGTGSLVNPGLFRSQLNSGVVYDNGGIYKTISAPVSYVQAPAVQVIRHQQPSIYQTAVSSPVITAPLIQHHAPIYRASSIVSPLAVNPVVSQSYGLSYGSSYGIGGIKNVYGGILKQ